MTLIKIKNRQKELISAKAKFKQILVDNNIMLLSYV